MAEYVTHAELLDFVRQLEDSRRADLRVLFDKLDALRDIQADRRANCERQDGRIIAIERGQADLQDRQDELETEVEEQARKCKKLLEEQRKDLEAKFTPASEQVKEWRIKASFLGMILAVLLSAVTSWDKIKGLFVVR